MKRFLFTGASLLLLVVGILVAVTHYQLTKPNLLAEPALLTVNNGSSFHQFTKQLKALGVIETRFWLRNYVRFYRNAVIIKAGTYQILPSQTLKQILQMVSQGKEHQFTITFIEGSTLKQWLALIRANRHITHTLDPQKNGYQQVANKLALKQSHPEGLFYPDTYAFTNQTSDVELLTRAYNKMRQELENAWANRDGGLPYDNAYQALTMASIIEKESGRHTEHELIASVFVNRLNQGMRLQTDPTIIYGLGDRYQGDIKRAHKKEKTAYNTYRINGLPPTPIAMPGKSAIHAAMHPAPSNYLYFVSNGQGKHIFTENLTDHNKAVVKYQLNR